MTNKLKHFDPFGGLGRFEPLRGMEEFFRDLRHGRLPREFDVPPLIKLDVAETEQEYCVKAELPGMKKEDISVDIDGNRIAIAAQITRESEQREGHTLVHSERYSGQQYRSFTLDKEVDDSKAVARYQDGILELTLPKKVAGASKKLLIN
ncbi:MAG: Hsp20/alpha crystallin family protein [Sphingomonadaceae bacterium]